MTAFECFWCDETPTRAWVVVGCLRCENLYGGEPVQEHRVCRDCAGALTYTEHSCIHCGSKLTDWITKYDDSRWIYASFTSEEMI